MAAGPKKHRRQLKRRKARQMAVRPKRKAKPARPIGFGDGLSMGLIAASLGAAAMSRGRP